MDACTELQPQSSPFGIEDSVRLQEMIRSESFSTPTTHNTSTDEIRKMTISDRTLHYDEQVDLELKQCSTTCPTSTPADKNNDRLSYTPQTSPPRSTPLKATLSGTEYGNVYPTGCTMTPSPADFTPECLSHSFPSKLMSKDTFKPSYTDLEKFDKTTNIHIEQKIQGSPRKLMSPVKLPLHELCSQNGIQPTNSPNLTSKSSSLKRTHAEIENDPSFALILQSPKKAKTAVKNSSENLRRSNVSRPFVPPKFTKGNSAKGSVTLDQSSPRTPVASSAAKSSKSGPKTAADVSSPSTKVHPQIRHTVAVSKPFKSPFKSPLSSLSTVTNKSASSPNIRALEKKVVMLKRANKILREKEDEKLKSLIEKWTVVGREVAWELWSIMKDRSPEDALTWGGKDDRFNNNWNWTNKRNWSFNERSEGCTEEEKIEDSSISSQFEAEMWNTINIKNTTKRQEAEGGASSSHTLGAMLRSYGITDDILGWNNEEEDFNPLA